MVDELDDDDKVIGRSSQLRFSKGYGRSKIWHGTLCENVVQATAADILRGTLARLEKTDLNVRLHSHDECLIDVPEDQVESAKSMLRGIMREGFDWSEGLPLMSEETIQPYYSKFESK
jgi:DNA polymerase